MSHAPMSSRNTGPFGATPADHTQKPGEIRSEANTTVHRVAMDLPNGKTAMVGLKIGNERAADADKQREQFLHNVHPASLTEGLEKEVARMTALFTEHTHFDRDGNPVMRVQGREREVLEMRLANRRNALALAQRDRALAEHVQAQTQRAKVAEQQRIDVAARLKAQQLIEQAEIDRRAKQMAARAGVVSK